MSTIRRNHSPARSSGRAVLSLASAIAIAATGSVLAAAAPASAAGEAVHVWQTDITNLNQAALTPEPALTFAAGAGTQQAITLNEGRSYQTMLGFGATFTDSSAWLMQDNLSASTRANVMQDLFTTTGPLGIGLSYLRQPTTSTDYNYDPNGAGDLGTFDDNGNVQDDATLSHFNINNSPSTARLIPILQQALQQNPNLAIQLNGWTAPAWMKDNDSLQGGGNLLPADESRWAQYIVKSIQAYEALGIPIWSTTVANEPTIVRDYPSMTISPAESADLVQRYLVPDLAAASLTTRILGGDDSPFSTNYPTSQIDSTQAVSAEIPGISTHGYFDTNPALMTAMHDDYPNRQVYQTELAPDCQTAWIDQNQSAIRTMFMATRNWSDTAVTWNVALNPSGGPHYQSPTAGSDCTPLVVVDPTSSTATYSPNFYEEGQFSKFVQPGAVRVDSNQLDPTNASNAERFLGLDDVAFKNPDGSKVLIAWNSTGWSQETPSFPGGYDQTGTNQTFSVNWGNEHFDYTLPPQGIATFTWSGSAAGDAAGWGDSTFGTNTTTPWAGGTQTGQWHVTNASTLQQNGFGDAFQSSYYGTADHTDLTVSATMQGVASGHTSTYPKYGIYACYHDVNNYVQAWIDPGSRVFATNMVENGQNVGFNPVALPTNYVPGGANSITSQKVGDVITFKVDDTPMPNATLSQADVVGDCQGGLVTQDYQTSFTNVSVSDPLVWGSSISGAQEPNNWRTTTWATADETSATDTAPNAVASLFRGYATDAIDSPMTVSATVQGINSGSGSTGHPQYGIYAAYHDEQNYVKAVIDPTSKTVVTDAIVGGTDQGAVNTALPSSFAPSQQWAIGSTRTGNSFSFTLVGPSGPVTVPGLTAAIGLGQPGISSRYYAADFRRFATSSDDAPSQPPVVGTDFDPNHFNPNLQYHIINRNSLTELSLLSGQTTDQNPAIIYDAVQASDQLWTITKTSQGFQLHNVRAAANSSNPATAGVLGLYQRQTANDTDATIFQNIGAPDQYWTIQPAGDGSNFLEIDNNLSHTALSVHQRETANSSNVIVWTYLGESQGALDQDWTIVPAHDIG